MKTTDFCGVKLLYILYLGLGTHLFVKVPRPGDSEVTFFGLRVKLPLVTISLTTYR